MIDLNNITVGIGTKVLLTNASAHIADGWKIGLVGQNGCGKTTLFRVLLGETETELGEINFPSKARVSTVAQEFKDIETSVLDFILTQDTERANLLSQLALAPESEQAEIHEQLKIIDAASAEGRACAILHGLGFTNNDFQRPIKEFSGGWRMRLALAAALFRPSDILLLDEPTNHLDLETSIWLENHLRRYRGTLLIISHDRYILNDLCDHILHFDNKKLVLYTGNYDVFQKTRTLQREVQIRQIAKQQAQRQHLQSYVDRFRYKATKAKQAQSRLKLLEKMEVLPPLSNEYTAEFNFPQPLELASPLLTMDDVSTGYDDNIVLKKLTLNIGHNDRIALLGANGNGKSTFAKLVSGRLSPISGNLIKSKKLEVGYFAQHQSEELPLDLTACQYLQQLKPEWTETRARAHLAQFGLAQEKSVTMINKLSGGEKARLLFAVMTLNAPSLLILDEPTNHLDIEGREALLNALNNYNGAVILITHDLHLIELMADDLWLVKNHTLKPFSGDLEDYKQILLENKSSTQKAQPAKQSEDKKKSGNYLQTKQLNSEIRRLEKTLEKLTEEKDVLVNRFTESLSSEELVLLQKKFSDLQKQIAETENLWLERSEQLDTLA